MHLLGLSSRSCFPFSRRFSAVFSPFLSRRSCFTQDNGLSPTMAYAEIERGQRRLKGSMEGTERERERHVFTLCTREVRVYTHNTDLDAWSVS